MIRKNQRNRREIEAGAGAVLRVPNMTQAEIKINMSEKILLRSAESALDRCVRIRPRKTAMK